jgi:hypothetical protein
MLTISNEDLGWRLGAENPWWDINFQTETFFQPLPKRAFYPAFFSRLQDPAKAGVLVLAGPPCVGKTTMLGHAIEDLLNSGVTGKQIFFMDLSTPSYAFSTPVRLVDAVGAGIGFDRDGDLYLFFDAVQYLDGWREKMQALASAWPNARIVVALSYDAGGKLPAEETFILPPLTFAEFLHSQKAGKFRLGGGESGGMTLSSSEIPALNEAFVEYVNYGGFPKGIVADNLAGRNGIGDPRDLQKLFAILARNTASEVTIEALTKAVGVAKNTLRKYLDFLEQAFLIRRLPRLDGQGKRFQRAVAFKVYLTAPCLYTALFGPVSGEDRMFSRLAETALVSQWMGVGSLAYASWRGGSIDLLEMNPQTDKPDNVFELDWRDGYATPGPKADKGPAELTAFVAATNPAAKTHILTATTARRGAMAGIDITLAPLALYAYQTGRAQTDRG